MSISSKILLPVVALSFFSSCGNKARKEPGKIYLETPSAYDDYISGRFDEVMRLFNATLFVMDDSLKAYTTLDSLSEAARNSQMEMIKLADFKGDTSYRYAAMQFFNTMAQMAEQEYSASIGIAIIREVPDSLHFRFKELGHIMGDKKDKAIQELQAAQMAFHQRFGTL